MRLIDVDKIEINEECMFSGKGVKDFLDAIPSAYDVDKVVERLEEYAHSSICNTHEHGCPYLTNDDVSCENCGAIGALEIVKFGGIE